MQLIAIKMPMDRVHVRRRRWTLLEVRRGKDETNDDKRFLRLACWKSLTARSAFPSKFEHIHVRTTDVIEDMHQDSPKAKRRHNKGECNQVCQVTTPSSQLFQYSSVEEIHLRSCVLYGPNFH